MNRNGQPALGLSGTGASGNPPNVSSLDFASLAAKWKKETRHLSSASRMSKHPAYREIIEMGAAAIPLILAELEKKPDHWFVALHQITGANPVPARSEGNV